MSQHMRGAVITTAAATYLLTYDFNKLCDMEQVGLDLLNGTVSTDKMSSPSFVRQLFFEGLTDSEGKPLPDLAAAGKIISEIGLTETTTKIAEALVATVRAANPQTSAQPQ